MGDLSENFSRWEFACKCGCGFDTVDAQLLSRLEALRNHFEQPVTINSGCRCVQHNYNVGGARHSLHRTGRAADVVVRNIDARLVAEWARDNQVPGVGDHPTFTHLDTRSGEVWWKSYDE